MKNWTKILAGAALALASSLSVAQAEELRYLVMFQKSELPKGFESRIQSAGGTVVSALPEVGIAVATSSNPSFIEQADRIRGVFGAALDLPLKVPDAVEGTDVSAAPESLSSFFFDAGLLWGIERVGAPEAWAEGFTGGKETVVAIIDTGIADNHPDLASNIVYMDCFTSGGTAADGGCNPYPELDDHGTHVAGTVAANAGGGVIGVGPELGLASYNTFEFIPGCGVCSFSANRWTAMLDAAQRGFDVINMSVGSLGQYGGGRSSGLATFVAAEKRIANAVLKQGTALVASAGNSGLDLNGTFINIPGGVPGIINVGATAIQPNPRFEPGTSFDIPAFYSNSGAALTLAAPGGDCGQIGTCNDNRPDNWFEYLILSTIVEPNPTCAATRSCPVTYGWKTGTSMAAPHVSGAVGMIKDANPSLTPQQVQNIMKKSAHDIGSRQLYGHGMLDVPIAIAEALK